MIIHKINEKTTYTMIKLYSTITFLLLSNTSNKRIYSNNKNF